MSLAINASLRATSEDKRKTYLRLGKSASQRVQKIIDELRKDSQVCGQQ